MANFKQGFQTFVISLPCAQERRAYMSDYLGKKRIDFTFIDAVDGRNFDVPNHPAHDTARRRAFFGRDLKGGELGCFLSHRKCYEFLVERDIPLALIFEDDVVLAEKFSEILNNAAQHSEKFDLLRFLTKPKLLKKPYKTVAVLQSPYEIAKTGAVPGGAYAYLITKEGAQKMLRKMERTYLPVDALMGQTWLTGARSYIVMPPDLAHVRAELGSDIGYERLDKTKLDVNGWQNLAYPLTRAGYKIFENLMKWTNFI